MPADRSRVYWDANVFLAFINDDPGRAPELASILDAARRGEIQLVTSVLSIVEVSYAAEDQLGAPISEETDHRIGSLWAPGSPVVPAEIHQGLAEKARELVRVGRAESRSLKPADAVHLATAASLNASDFHTYDRDLHRWSGQLGFAVREPIARAPRLPGTGA